MLATDTSWKRSLLRTAFSSILLIAAACGDDTEFPPNNGWPTFDAAVTTPDASGAQPEAGGGTGGDASTPKPDGSVAPGMDANVNPQPDTGVGAPDTGVVADGGMDATVEGDAGDAGLDGAIDGGDGAVADAGDASGGDAGDASVGDGGNDAGPRPDQGKGNGQDVITMGDSWMNNTLGGTGGGIAPALRSASGQPYRDYAKQGTKMLSIGLLLDPPIPNQWDQAVRANRNIKTVIMTGGGNDVILGSSAVQRSCQEGSQLCKDELTKIGNALSTLWTKMSQGGVQDIIHIIYAKAANGDNLNEALGNSNNEALKALCAAVPAPTRCHIFFTDTYVPRTSDLADGIHPVPAANQRIARGLVEYMAKEGIRR